MRTPQTRERKRMRNKDRKAVKNPNHPPKGASIRVDPIRNLDVIEQIKGGLALKPRDLCLFTLGINTGLRANELLSLTVGQVAHAKPGRRLVLKQSKTNAYRTVFLNSNCANSIRFWIESHPIPDAAAPLFLSRKRSRGLGGIKPLAVPPLSGMVKEWCALSHAHRNLGSHSLRKTWGYHQRITNKASVALLMRAFGHKSEAQTLNYLGIEDDEIRKLYELEL